MITLGVSYHRPNEEGADAIYDNTYHMITTMSYMSANMSYYSFGNYVVKFNIIMILKSFTI